MEKRGVTYRYTQMLVPPKGSEGLYVGCGAPSKWPRPVGGGSMQLTNRQHFNLPHVPRRDGTVDENFAGSDGILDHA